MASKNLVGPTHLTTVAEIYYTGPSGLTATITGATITNTSSDLATVTVYIVPSGSAAAAENTIIPAQRIEAGECFIAAELVSKIVEEGWTIEALASEEEVLTLSIVGKEE